MKLEEKMNLVKEGAVFEREIKNRLKNLLKVSPSDDEENMDFGEKTGTVMGDKVKDRLKNRLNAPSKTANYCRAIVTEDCEANDTDFGEGARGITFKMEGTKTVFGGCTCTKEEYELLCANYNVSDTLVGTTVEVIMDAIGLISGIR